MSRLLHPNFKLNTDLNYKITMVMMIGPNKNNQTSKIAMLIMCLLICVKSYYPITRKTKRNTEIQYQA